MSHAMMHQPQTIHFLKDDTYEGETLCGRKWPYEKNEGSTDMRDVLNCPKCRVILETGSPEGVAPPDLTKPTKINEQPVSPDPINPPHYPPFRGVECHELAQSFGFHLGNVLKYIWRAPHAGKRVLDLKKARQYLDFAIEAAQTEKSE